MKTIRTTRNNGFCLIELIGSMVILLGVTGAAIAGISWYQHHARAQAMDLHAGGRLGVASVVQNAPRTGAVASVRTTITSSSVRPSSLPQAVKVNSTAGLFAGEKVVVDRGDARETVAIRPLNSTTILGVFTRSHARGAAVDAPIPASAAGR